MTEREKIELLKNTIIKLYCNEGRSKSYISRLLEVDRKTLIKAINEDWKLEKGNVSYLTPSNQKFANKNKNLIISKLDNDISISKIANELKVTSEYLSNIIKKVPELNEHKIDYINRQKINAQERKNQLVEKSSLNYDWEELPDEEWKEILGYSNYYISNMGRVKKYIKTYDKYVLLSLNINSKTGRVYTKIEGKGLQVSRLVGFAFLDGYSEEKNTIEHIDNDVTNNKASNLMWVSMGDNNKLAYKKGKAKSKAFTKRRGKWKKIILDDKYEFKTIVALAKFLGKSETQINRYINGETNCSDHTFKFIY
jgi:plasmid maintenance system antidote protein VapI